MHQCFYTACYIVAHSIKKHLSVSDAESLQQILLDAYLPKSQWAHEHEEREDGNLSIAIAIVGVQCTSHSFSLLWLPACRGTAEAISEISYLYVRWFLFIWHNKRLAYSKMVDLVYIIIDGLSVVELVRP